MGSRKTQEEKDFLITIRRKISDRLSPAPVWVTVKSGKRHYNQKQRRHWRETHLMLEFAAQNKKTAGIKTKTQQRKKIRSQIKKYNKKTGERR
ncbi:MAG: hypothetical protein J4215_01600 [Candidatus Diapherotrites archaeon]|uniref:50S ribosomal protein L39e n=1 Tax=Candidatus Iainarchaeum sp. TaxID=3101447 RepID=A0A8T4L3W0_9ARCH|nr:hypothetical protein [Candidatus Diapherotrites archaeon]